MWMSSVRLQRVLLVLISLLATLICVSIKISAHGHTWYQPVSQVIRVVMETTSKVVKEPSSSDAPSSFSLSTLSSETTTQQTATRKPPLKTQGSSQTATATSQTSKGRTSQRSFTEAKLNMSASVIRRDPETTANTKAPKTPVNAKVIDKLVAGSIIRGASKIKKYAGKRRGRSNFRNRPEKPLERILVNSTGETTDCGTTVTMETKIDYNTIYQYPTRAHIRFIVLTYDRAESLSKVLNSLQGVELDGHTGNVEIWIDRSRTGSVDTETLKVARSFCWDSGTAHVHVHGDHVGLYGQWINTWSRDEGINETSRTSRKVEPLIIILEDDTDLSKFAYRWLRAAHVQYGGLTHVSGYSLQSENVMIARGPKQHTNIDRYRKGLVYGFPVAGSWGFAPHPDRWEEFQSWYVRKFPDVTFKPYVTEAAMHTGWYKKFEREGTEDGMWTMWFIRFCWENKLYSIYSNIPYKLGHRMGSLVSNRKEKGLHYGKPGPWSPKLMKTWNAKSTAFQSTVNIYGYMDEYIKIDRVN